MKGHEIEPEIIDLYKWIHKPFISSTLTGNQNKRVLLAIKDDCCVNVNVKHPLKILSLTSWIIIKYSASCSPVSKNYV